MSENSTNFTHRFVANITIEAKTALKVGSGDKSFFKDAPVQKDWNNLPMILGTSLAGVIRAKFSQEKADDFFGDENSKSKNAKGSRVIISNALLLDENLKVNEGLLLEKSNFLQNFSKLPQREHNAINDKGTTIKNSKFDEEVVFKGASFRFNLSFLNEGTDEDEKVFYSILDVLATNDFRIGGGSTKGYGKIEVKSISFENFALDDFQNFTNSLNINLATNYKAKEDTKSEYIAYNITLKPDDFFMFGSGFGDKEADMTPVYEKVVDYEAKKLTKEQILIPASSVKGALSHRTAFHWNKINKKYIGDSEARNNIDEIFGSKKEKNKKATKGKILIGDAFIKEYETKVFDHVSIDRFTGGAIDGALFQEKTSTIKDKVELEILLKKEVGEVPKRAFEKALDDICNGMLPLGGATTKGHGVFTGGWKNDK